MSFKTVRWRFDQKPRASWASLAGLRFARGLYLYLPRAILTVSFRVSQRPMATELAVPYFLTARTLDHPLAQGRSGGWPGSLCQCDVETAATAFHPCCYLPNQREDGVRLRESMGGTRQKRWQTSGDPSVTDVVGSDSRVDATRPVLVPTWRPDVLRLSVCEKLIARGPTMVARFLAHGSALSVRSVQVTSKMDIPGRRAD